MSIEKRVFVIELELKFRRGSLGSASTAMKKSVSDGKGLLLNLGDAALDPAPANSRRFRAAEYRLRQDLSCSGRKY